MADVTAGLLDPLLAVDAPPFALLRREGAPGVELLLGELVEVERLADIPLPGRRPGAAGQDVLAAVPFRQVTERGFACRDDRAPLPTPPRSSGWSPTRSAVARVPTSSSAATSAAASPARPAVRR